MNFEPLKRRLEKLREQAEQRFPPKGEPFTFSFAWHLFSEQEQARLQRFVRQIEPKCTRVHGRPDFLALTEQEAQELGLWLHLEQALTQEHLADAALYRRWLNTSLDELLALFLSIEEGNTTTEYRNIKRNWIENPSHQLHAYEQEQMWRWVQWYEQEQGITR